MGSSQSTRFEKKEKLTKTWFDRFFADAGSLY